VAGSYTIRVDVRTAGGAASQANASTSYVLAFPTPATGLTVTPSLPSPQYIGTAVTFTASGSGATFVGQPAPAALYQYRFYVMDTAVGTWVLAQDYSPSATWAMPGSYAVGTYRVSVDVRTTSGVWADVNTQLAYTISYFGPATGLSVTASPASPSLLGTPVTFTAVGSGSQGGYQYRFYVKNQAIGTWVLVQDYSPANTWTMAGITGAGDYVVSVDVRTTPLVWADANSQVAYTITAPPSPAATGLTVTASPTSPHVAGTPVTFTAAGSGGSGSYQYRFYTMDTAVGTWSLVQDYSPTATWTMPGTYAPSSYRVSVDVRTSPSVWADVNNQQAYVITP
jgi:hypothetical protein